MNIVCFLVKNNPNQILIDFCKTLINNYKVYICIDKLVKSNFQNISNINIIYYEKGICEREGFKGSVFYCIDRACSRDKALYFFCKNNIHFNNIWFIEEDVFLYNVETLLNIDYQYPNVDLISSDNNILSSETSNAWNNWLHVSPLVFKECRLNFPYSRSMICAIRCSKKLINCIKIYNKKFKNLFLDEALFNTLAIHNNLTIVVPIELKNNIVFNRNWKIEEMKKEFIYHPIKSLPKQKYFRELLHRRETKNQKNKECFFNYDNLKKIWNSRELLPFENIAE